jgi:hypothetical protein
MKKVLPVFLLAGISLLFFSCKKPDTPSTTINLNFQVPLHQVLDSTQTTGKFTLEHDSIRIDVDSALGTQKIIQMSDLKDVHLSSVTFTMDSGATSFYFLKDMSSSFSMGGSGHNGGHKHTINKNAATFSLDSSDNYNFLPDLNNGRHYVNFSFTGTNDVPVSGNAYMTITLVFLITATKSL